MRILEFYDGFNSSTQPDIEFLDTFDNAALAPMPANTLKGNNTGSVANPKDLTLDEVKTLLSITPASFDSLAPTTTKGDLIIRSSSGNTRFPVGSNGQVPVADSSQTTGLRWDSASKGSKNYVTYSDFENGLITGWSVGGTLTLTNTKLPSGIPTFNSSTPATFGNATLSTVSSGQLSGTGSLKLVTSDVSTVGNFLASDPLTLDSSDQAKVLSFKFNYKVLSGTINASGTSSNSFGVAIYDVTNSQWIIPTGAFNIVQTAGVGTAQGTFQTPSNMTSFRIVVYNANATSAAVTMLFDDFYVGPQSLAFGPAVGDWTQYTTTLSNCGNATSNFWYARRGDTIHIKGSITLGSTLPTGVFTFTLPSGLSIDFTKHPNGITGSLIWLHVGDANYRTVAGTYFNGIVYSNNASPNTFMFNSSGETASSANWALNVPTTSNAGDVITIPTFSVPIAGWSSNTVMSNDSDTRIVAAYISAGSIVNGNPLSFGAATLDTHSAWNGTTTYTVPVSGVYRVSGQLQFTVTAASAGLYFNLAVFKNTVLYTSQTKRASGAATVTDSFPLSPVLVRCNAGDTITVGCPGTNYNVVTASADASWLLIERVSGNAVVAASETVAAKYSTDVGQTMTNNAFSRVNFYSKEFDSHNAVTTGVGVWTFKAPVSGRYLVSGTATITGAIVGSTNILGGIYKNDVIYARGPQAGISTGTTGAMATTIVPCLAGETISFWLFQANGADRYLETSLICNHIEIVKIGNL